MSSAWGTSKASLEPKETVWFQRRSRRGASRGREARDKKQYSSITSGHGMLVTEFTTKMHFSVDIVVYT